MNAVDLWDGETYRRVLAVDDKPALVAVTQQATMLDITVTGEDLPPTAEQASRFALDRLLGIRLAGVYCEWRHSKNAETAKALLLNLVGCGFSLRTRITPLGAVSYTHLRAHETRHDLVCRLLLEKKK